MSIIAVITGIWYESEYGWEMAMFSVERDQQGHTITYVEGESCMFHSDHERTEFLTNLMSKCDVIIVNAAVPPIVEYCKLHLSEIGYVGQLLSVEVPDAIGKLARDGSPCEGPLFTRILSLYVVEYLKRIAHG